MIEPQWDGPRLVQMPVRVMTAYSPGTWTYVQNGDGRGVAVQVCCGPPAPYPVHIRTADQIAGVPPEQRTPAEIFRYGSHGPYVKPMPVAAPTAAVVATGAIYRSDQDSRPHPWMLALSVLGSFAYAYLGVFIGYPIGGAL